MLRMGLIHIVRLGGVGIQLAVRFGYCACARAVSFQLGLWEAQGRRGK